MIDVARTAFTPWRALAGGVLVGVAAAPFLLTAILVAAKAAGMLVHDVVAARRQPLAPPALDA